MDVVRPIFIWTGVAASHAALLVAAWGFGSEYSSRGESWVTVTLIGLVDSKPADSCLSEVPDVTAGISVPAVSFAQAIRPSVSAPSSSQLSSVVRPGPSEGIEVEPPRFNLRVEPIYPRAARLAGREGKVCLQLEILRNGTLHRATVTLSSGDVALDRAAVEAAERSTYHPATSADGPLEASVEATYRFVLR